MIRNVILDWSGTLVDDLDAVLEATNEVLRRAGVEPMTRERFRAEFELPFKGFYRRFTPGIPADQLEAWFHGRFREVQALVRELPQARAFLEFCRERGYRTLLLSTMHPEHYATQAGANHFDAYFDHAYLGIRDKRAKIREILETHGWRPEETLFVGDMEHDVETARHGGIRSVAVLTGYNDGERLRKARPDLLVRDLGELKRILEGDGLSEDIGERHRDRRLPVVTVGAAIFDGDGRVLMIRTHKWSDLWGIPGGKVERGERAEDALRREIAEETGLEVDEVRFVLVQDCIDSPEFYRREHFVLLNYQCRARAGEVRLNDEGEDYRWVEIPEALGMSLNHPTRVLLEALARRVGPSGAACGDRICLRDVEVDFKVGVPEEERSRTQRLLITVEMETSTAEAAAADDLARTVDYHAVYRRLVALGEGREWRLIETLAVEVAEMVLREFRPAGVAVEVRKFILPRAGDVRVRVERRRMRGAGTLVTCDRCVE